jgi:hypothetical protein
VGEEEWGFEPQVTKGLKEKTGDTGSSNEVETNEGPSVHVLSSLKQIDEIDEEMGSEGDSSSKETPEEDKKRYEQGFSQAVLGKERKLQLWQTKKKTNLSSDVSGKPLDTAAENDKKAGRKRELQRCASQTPSPI